MTKLHEDSLFTGHWIGHQAQLIQVVHIQVLQTSEGNDEAIRLLHQGQDFPLNLLLGHWQITVITMVAAPGEANERHDDKHVVTFRPLETKFSSGSFKDCGFASNFQRNEINCNHDNNHDNILDNNTDLMSSMSMRNLGMLV